MATRSTVTPDDVITLLTNRTTADLVSPEVVMTAYTMFVGSRAAIAKLFESPECSVCKADVMDELISSSAAPQPFLDYLWPGMYLYRLPTTRSGTTNGAGMVFHLPDSDAAYQQLLEQLKRDKVIYRGLSLVLAGEQLRVYLY